MGKPILFTQYRVGKNDKPFKIYKFRTMKNGSHSVKYAQEGDPRITKFGMIMRRFRLDELPQFYNILLGNMSLIGPRPEPVAHAKGYYESIPNYSDRHLVRPGITGYAQVAMGYANTEDATKIKVGYDLDYIARHSFLFDLKIVFKTVVIILTGFGVK